MTTFKICCLCLSKSFSCKLGSALLEGKTFRTVNILEHMLKI